MSAMGSLFPFLRLPDPDAVCDKCGTPKRNWSTTPCVQSLVRSSRHVSTRQIYMPPTPRQRVTPFHELLDAEDIEIIEIDQREAKE